MPNTSRGKRVPDAAGAFFRVVNKAPNGRADSFFDWTREVWVAPWASPTERSVARPAQRVATFSTKAIARAK